MLIYKVRALVMMNIDELELNINSEEMGDITSEEIEEIKEATRKRIYETAKQEGHPGKTTGSTQFYIGAEGFLDAVSESIDYLDATKNDYDIISVTEVLDEGESIDVVNMDKECTCPFCRFSKASADDKMIFHCSTCNEEIKVADGDWESIRCPNEMCKTEIKRSDIVVGVDGKYFVVAVIEKENKEKKTRKNSKKE